MIKPTTIASIIITGLCATTSATATPKNSSPLAIRAPAVKTATRNTASPPARAPNIPADASFFDDKIPDLHPPFNLT